MRRFRNRLWRIIINSKQSGKFLTWSSSSKMNENQFSSITQWCPTLYDPMDYICHQTISSYVNPFSSRLQSSPASGPFPMSQCFASGGQSIGVSALASILPMNIQDWFPLGLTGWISLQSKGLSRVIQHHSSKALILWCSAFFIVQLSHPYMTTGKSVALARWAIVSK